MNLNLFVPAPRKLLNGLPKLNVRAAQWTDNNKRAMQYSEGQSELCLFVPKPSARSLGLGLPRPAGYN